MDFFEVCQIGRESVKSVNASILAALIRQLVNKYEQHKGKSQNYKCYIKCKEKFEILQKRIGEDEGFESDANEEEALPADSSNEDTRSTTSSCYLVDDHVFRLSKIDRDLVTAFPFTKESDSPNSMVGSSDSANSSGGSDTDEIDVHSLTPSPVGQGEKFKSQDLAKKRLDRVGNFKREEFPIGDVIICHTDPKYPTIIAWVIKKAHADYDISSRLGKTGVETIPKNDNCLEVVITRCKTIDTLRELCSSYQEFSKRVKLDQYKSINRKKDQEQKKCVSLAALLDGKETKVSLSDMKISSSGLIKASELSILNPKIMTSFQPDMKNSVSLSSLIKSEQKLKPGVEGKVPESEVGEETPRKAQSLLNLSKIRDGKSEAKNSNVLKDISSGLNDHFNLVQRTDLNGITHLEVSKGAEPKSILPDRYSSKSKIRKEIEGVILTEADSYAKKEPVRQRQSPGLLDQGTVWRLQENLEDSPPIRPERRRFIKKKGLAPSPPVNRYEQPVGQEKGKNTFYLTQPPQSDGQKVVKGQYIRVQSWGNQNNPCEGSLGSWKGVENRERLSRKSEERYGERRRSKSATRTGKRTPMAYRYIDITDESYYPGGGSRLYGLSQKIREFGGNVVGGVGSGGNPRRRRNSFDDIIHLDGRCKGNLKSVIKKNKKINDKCCEPKKVTFSAFATVQVVD